MAKNNYKVGDVFGLNQDKNLHGGIRFIIQKINSKECQVKESACGTLLDFTSAMMNASCYIIPGASWPKLN